MDLYSKLGDELRSLFKDLFTPSRKKAVEGKILAILETSTKIGGSIQKEAEQLVQDVEQFIKSPKNKKSISTMKKHALRLEQETRLF